MKPVILLLFITLGVVSCARINFIFENFPVNEDTSDDEASVEDTPNELFVNPGLKALFRKQVNPTCDSNVCNSDCKKHDNGKTGRCISGECFCNDNFMFI